MTDAVRRLGDARAVVGDETRDPLSRAHRALIDASSIDPSVANERGYRTVTIAADLKRLGFSDRQARVPALLVPVHGVHGDIVTYQLRPDAPRVADNGRAIKYETPHGSQMAIDVPRRTRARLSDPSTPLFITEGARKADAGVSKSLCVVALLGVWNWRGKNDDGGTTALADWESIALNGREVYVAFDSDVVQKRAVHGALSRLKSFLESRKASVRIIYLPPGEGGVKVGLDDFFAAGRTVDELLACSTETLREPLEGAESDATYVARDGGIWWNKQVEGNTCPVRLSNFIARIAAELVLDDGVTSRREFEVVVELGGRKSVITTPATAFQSLNWLIEATGARGIVTPGLSLRGHLVVAIQTVSTEIVEKKVYTHTGWREIDGVGWVFLHAAGAIGPNGPVPGTHTRLHAQLARYVLAEPPDAVQLPRDVKALRDLLALAPDAVGLPLMAAIVRVLFGDTPFGIHLVGPTGVFKTELAVLFQSFFGAGFDSRNLPGSWSGTANSIEAITFFAKDVAVVVDDYAPGGSGKDAQQLNRTADRVFRGQGNGLGRSRLDAASDPRPTRWPRGVVISTGEEVPSGSSMRARMVIIALQDGDIAGSKLTACQVAARDGAYARVFSAYIKDLASRFPSAKDRQRHRAIELRDKGSAKGGHRRTPDNAAHLQSAFEDFTEFLVRANSISPAERDELVRRCEAALDSLAKEQAAHVAASEPTEVCLRLIGSAIASGAAHLASKDGVEPEDRPSAFGWRRGDANALSPCWTPWGVRVGWVDGDDVYLNVDAMLRVANSLAPEGERIPLTERTLARRMRERGRLKTWDQARGKNTVRRVVEGRRVEVLHLSVTTLELQAQQAHSALGVDGEPIDKGSTPIRDLNSQAHEATPADPSVPEIEPIAPRGDRIHGVAGPDGPEGPLAESRLAEHGDTCDGHANATASRDASALFEQARQFAYDDGGDQ